MPKLDFDQILTALAEERPIKPADVRASVLRRRVWLMQYSAPGCLADHSEVCRTRRDALESAALLYAEDAPRGFVTALRRNGIAPTDSSGYYRVEVSCVRVQDLF